MKIVYFFLSCYFLLCAGCTGKPAGEDELFLEKQPLAGRVWLTDDVLLDPDGLLVTDSLLLLSNRNDSLHMEAFRLSDGQHVGHFLSKGEGPEEFIFLTSMQWDAKDRAVYVSDFASQKLFRYDEAAILQGRPSPTPIRLPDSNRLPDDVHFTSYWVCPWGTVAQNVTGKGRIGLITPDSLIVWGEYPPAEKVDPRLADDPIAQARLYQSMVAFSPAGDKIALACGVADMLDVYTLHADRITTDWSYWHAFPDEIVVMPSGGGYMAGLSQHSTYHYLSICASDRFIFILYSGKKIKEKDNYISSRIRMVSWDRTQSKEWVTTDNLRAISLSPDGNLLYGINQTEEGYEVKIYDLKSYLL